MKGRKTINKQEDGTDAFDDYGNNSDRKDLPKILPNQRDKRISKIREWSSDTFSGSVKELRRVCKKLSRPSKNVVITTAKIHNEEQRKKEFVIKKSRHVSKTGTGQLQYKKQPCISYEPDVIDVLESIEIPAKETKKGALIEKKSPTKPGHSPVTRERSVTSIKAPSKPVHPSVTRGRSRISGYYLRPLNSSSVPEESSVKRKRPRRTVEHFETGECPSEPEELPVKKRRTGVPSGSVQKKSSPPKRTISSTHDKESKDANSNGNISEPTNGLRRSSRFRVPPLDIWRNERLVFETLPSGEVKCSVDKGSEEDKFGLIQIAKRAERRIQMKKKKVQTVENTPIVDTKTGETVHALLHRPFESLQWSMPPNEVERPPPYIAVKAFRSNSTSFGFIDISPLSIKETQYSPLENRHYVLMKGTLK
ncbi:CENP-C_C domain-containing protein [Trichonephila clavipes]|nr:CENP-C_C domain-containing protein [Trichonephila clavipes]